MRSELRIQQLQLSHSNGRVRYTVDADGNELWFELPDNITLRCPGDFFVACMLLEAMVSDRNIRVAPDIGISSELSASLFELQPVYCLWNTKLKETKILADNISSIGAVHCGGVSTYSGGIDSSYTLARHLNDISHVVTLNTFEGREQPAEYQALIRRHSQVLAQLNVTLIPITSNYRELTERLRISHQFQHGIILGALSLLLGFEKTFIPSGFNATLLYPWGSHPLTDPLWSGNGRNVIHDGPITRVAKTKYLAANPMLLNNIQVCWKHVIGNCGQCHKCLRTMGALHFFGMQSEALPALKDLNLLLTYDVKSEQSVPFVEELALLALNTGHEHIAKKLFRKIDRFWLTFHLQETIKALTGDTLRKAILKFRGQDWSTYRVRVDDKHPS